MSNYQSYNPSIGLKIALFVLWPVMIYVAYKIGRTKFYAIIIVAAIAINVGLSMVLPFPYSLASYAFYLYFAFRLLKEVNSK